MAERPSDSIARLQTWGGGGFKRMASGGERELDKWRNENAPLYGLGSLEIPGGEGDGRG
jgi:hypothetical protein